MIDRFPVVVIILCFVQVVEQPLFIAGIMTFPANGIIMIAGSASVLSKRSVEHYGTKNGIYKTNISHAVDVIRPSLDLYRVDPPTGLTPFIIEAIGLSCIILELHLVIVAHITHAVGESKCATVIKTDDHV